MAEGEHQALLALEAAALADVEAYGACSLADKARVAALSAGIQGKLSQIRALTRDLELLVEELDSDEEREQVAALLGSHKAEYARLQAVFKGAALAQRTAALRGAAEERAELLASPDGALRQRRLQAAADSEALARDVTQGLRRTRQVLGDELEHTAATLAAMEASHTQLGATRDEYHGQHGRLRRSRGLLGTLSWQAKSETYMLWAGLGLFVLVCAYIFQKRAGHFIPNALKPSGLLKAAGLTGRPAPVPAPTSRLRPQAPPPRGRVPAPHGAGEDEWAPAPPLPPQPSPSADTADAALPDDPPPYELYDQYGPAPVAQPGGSVYGQGAGAEVAADLPPEPLEGGGEPAVQQQAQEQAPDAAEAEQQAEPEWQPEPEPLPPAEPEWQPEPEPLPPAEPEWQPEPEFVPPAEPEWQPEPEPVPPAEPEWQPEPEHQATPTDAPAEPTAAEPQLPPQDAEPVPAAQPAEPHHDPPVEEAAPVDPPQHETQAAPVDPPQPETQAAPVDPPQPETQAAPVDPPQHESQAAPVDPPQHEAQAAPVDPPPHDPEPAPAHTEPAPVEQPPAEALPTQPEPETPPAQPEAQEVVATQPPPEQQHEQQPASGEPEVLDPVPQPVGDVPAGDQESATAVAEHHESAVWPEGSPEPHTEPGSPAFAAAHAAGGSAEAVGAAADPLTASIIHDHQGRRVVVDRVEDYVRDGQQQQQAGDEPQQQAAADPGDHPAEPARPAPEAAEARAHDEL